MLRNEGQLVMHLLFFFTPEP